MVHFIKLILVTVRFFFFKINYEILLIGLIHFIYKNNSDLYFPHKVPSYPPPVPSHLETSSSLLLPIHFPVQHVPEEPPAAALWLLLVLYSPPVVSCRTACSASAPHFLFLSHPSQRLASGFQTEYSKLNQRDFHLGKISSLFKLFYLEYHYIYLRPCKQNLSDYQLYLSVP